jgi:CheY-like chemotaxis protein
MSRAPLKDTGTQAAKATGLLREVEQLALPTDGPPNIDTVRALCHDLRQPLAAIMLLARSEGGDIRDRMDGILDQAQWLSDMVEGVIGDAAEDLPTNVDVAELASRCVLLAQPTAACQVRFVGADRAMAVAAPVALSRAVNCVLDNAVRAAGHGGHVTVEVASTDAEITIRVIDDGPGLGHVPPNNSLGLTIARALVSACGGTFELKPGTPCGMVAQIVLTATRKRSGDVMRLLLCDDHRPLLDALSMALRDRGHTVVATALNPDEAVEAARRHQPDACLLDVNFRHANGLNAIGRILEVSPDTKVVMLSGSISRSLMAEAIAKGAQGFVGKEKPVGVIIEALEMAHQGHLAVALR